MNIFKKHKYDLIFGIGEACSCSQLLRVNFLQFVSYPLDWLFGTDFIGRCKILANDFNNFINKDDLEYAFVEKSINCNAYHNKYNDITFNHDFRKDIPFDEMYNQVKEKYARRITRLIDDIEKSNKILVVYLEIPTINHNLISEEDIIKGFNLIKKRYPEKDIDLIYIKNSNIAKLETKQLTKNITFFKCNYKNNKSEFDNDVEFSKLNMIIKQYCLNKSFNKVLKMNFLRFGIRIIPNKKVRQNLRKKYHIYRK